MDEPLQEALAQLINESIGGVESASNFLQAEIPDVIYQLLMWHGIYNFIIFLIGIIFLSAIPFCGFRIRNTEWKERPDKEQIISIILGMCTFLLSLFGLVLINLQWLQIWIAPKVWLLEYAKEFLG